MSTTTAEPTVDATNLVDDAQAAAEHADAASLAVIRHDQRRFDEQQVAILRQIGLEDATQGDLDLFFHVCRTTGLDPFRKQIYMIGRNTLVKEWVDDDRAQNGRRQVERWVTKYTIQTGIDGYRRNVREAAKTLGDDLRFEGPFYTGENDFHVNEATGEVIQHWRKVWSFKMPPHAARFVTIRNGEEFEGIAHFDEFVQTGRNGEPNSMWRKMPRNQIAKCAESLSYRRAYPDDLGGLILEDAAQPTVIDGDTGEVIREGRPARNANLRRPAPVTVDEIFAEEVPIPDQTSADPVDATSEQIAEQVAAGKAAEAAARERIAEHTAPEQPAGDVIEDQGAGPADPAPSPAAQQSPTSSAGAKPEPERVTEAAAKAASKKIAAKRTTAPAANPDKPKSRMRAALEKRHFTLMGDAGLSGDKDRDGRLAVYQAILERPVESSNDLDDVALTKVSDQIYVWQQQNELDDQIAGILSDAAREAQETAAATAPAPTSEGSE